MELTGDSEPTGHSGRADLRLGPRDGNMPTMPSKAKKVTKSKSASKAKKAPVKKKVVAKKVAKKAGAKKAKSAAKVAMKSARAGSMRGCCCC